MTNRFSMLSGFLPTPRGVVAVTLWSPSDSPLRAVVVLCPPLFEERKASAIAVTSLARSLAAEGIAAIRFDPQGTGDSPGALSDARLAVWREELAAVRRHGETSGVPVILFGLRSGALLAAAEDADHAAAALVLWEPVANGTDALRQAVQRKLVNDMAAFGAAAANRASLDAAWERGEAVDLDGYRVSAGLAADLRGFAPRANVATPALWIATRAGRATEAAVSGLCPAAEIRPHAVPPFWTTVGLVDVQAPVAEIVAWLAGRFPAGVATAAAWPPPLATTHGGETHVCIASKRGDRLHAVWHGPDSAPPRRLVLFLSGWTGCGLGPHNVFVTLARRLASEGVGCLRIDFGGRGDSEGDPAATSIAGMTDDARSALAWLRERRGDCRGSLAIVAICSGCKVAIGAAAAESDVRALCLWSPEPMGSLRPSATNRRKTRAALRTYFLKLLRPETWRKLLSGRVRGGMVRKALLAHETRAEDEATREDAVLARFRDYRGRVFAVFGDGDPEAAGSEAAYGAFCARHGIPWERRVIARAGHSFYRAEWADELVAATASALSDPVLD